MARDREYVAGYRAGYHGDECDYLRSPQYLEGYGNGREHRVADDWESRLSAVERAEDGQGQARIEWMERERTDG